MDMWNPFIASTKSNVTGAETKIVFDRFHTMKLSLNNMRHSYRLTLLLEGDHGGALIVMKSVIELHEHPHKGPDPEMRYGDYISLKNDCEIHTFIGMFSTGLTGARNKAMEFCKGNLYWQIDANNFAYNEGTLKKLVEPFMTIDGIMIAVPMISYFPEMSGIDKWFANYHEIKLKEMISKGTIAGNWATVDDMTYGPQTHH